MVGRHLAVWIAHASDPEVRFRGSSGGVLTALSHYLLAHRGIEFVAHTKMHNDEPWRTTTAISRSHADLLEGMGSRYAPSSVCDTLSEIQKANGKTVFIGRPCDVAALKLATFRQPKLAERLEAVLTFFCAGTPSSAAVEELVDRAKRYPDERITELHFRGEGWPGQFRFQSDRRPMQPYYSYEEAWGEVQRLRGLRCHLCADGMGELADVSCGDAWHLHQGDGNPGLSVVVARTERGQALVEDAEAQGYLTLRQADESEVLASQGTNSGIAHRRQVVWGRIVTLKALRLSSPSYSGFPLFRSWLRLSGSEKLRSVLGTAVRVFRKRLHKGLTLE